MDAASRGKATIWRKVRLSAVVLIILMAVCASRSWGDEETKPVGRAVLAEINLARQQPRQYAAFLERFRGAFRGKQFKVAGSSTVIRTNEGVAAVAEAIRFLRQRKPLPPLSWSPGLARAAAELANEQGGNGATGHGGGASGGMGERIERQGVWRDAIGENIAYGPSEARDVVMQLIIDDGVPDRGHRANLFSHSFAVVGIACGVHPRFESVCVMDFAGGFGE